MVLGYADGLTALFAHKEASLGAGVLVRVARRLPVFVRFCLQDPLFYVRNV